MNVSEADLIASICRESLYEFVKEFWEEIIHEPLIDAWYIKYICDEMQVLAERVFKMEKKEHDLVINIPPGCSKSTMCSQMFPAWVWTRMPSARFICGTYSFDLSLKDSIACRDIIESDKYRECFPEIELRKDENRKGRFTNTLMGFRQAASVGGTVTGFHAHFLIVDDPLNPKQAASELELRAANDWMEKTLPSRKIRFAKNVVPMILIQQRLTKEDPSGRMIQKDKVKHICLPGELRDWVSPPELKKEYVEDLLDPVRLGKEVLEEAFNDLGEAAYAGQILQSPIPEGGAMFQVDKLVLMDDITKRFTTVVRSWDKAGTDRGGAWSVGVKMGIDTNKNYWILDVVRGQWNSTMREDMIYRTACEDGKEVVVVLEQEGGSGGKESAQSTVRMLAGWPKVFAYHPTGSKPDRARPLSVQMGAGNVYLLIRPWTKTFIDELRWFRDDARDLGTKYVDQVDAAAAAFNYLSKKKKVVGAGALRRR